MKKTLDDWLKWQETLHTTEIDLGLGRIRQVADRLDLLNPNFPIITIAGTNGKGSSVAFFEAMLLADDYTTGSYTSPHLIQYNERIKLSGINANDAQIIAAFEEIDKARKDVSLSYFEFGTLAAMLIFTQQAVDIAILEVGLGGRLDAANLWDTSLAIITSIAIDHESWLGNDREKIGTEKAGIMRANTPVICGDPTPPDSIKNIAKKTKATLQQINKDFSFQQATNNTWVWQNNKTQYQLPKPSLRGEFQLNNAATVIAGLKSISKHLPVSLNAIRKGLKNATIMGRLQCINTSPDWLIDVAHNPHSALALSNHLDEHPSSGKTIALFSMLKDKDIKQVLSIMNRHIDEWHIVGLEGSRGITTKELISTMKTAKIEAKVIPHSSFSDAVYLLKKDCKNKDKVVVFGSFLVISNVIEVWGS